MRAIQMFAAQCRQSGKRRAGEWRAPQLKACGWSGTLRAALPLIEAEVVRQEKLHAARLASMPYRYATAMQRCLDTLGKKRSFLDRLARAKQFGKIAPTSIGTYHLGDTLVEIAHWCDEDWNRYSKSWHNSYGPARTKTTEIVCSRWDAATHALIQSSYPQSALHHMDRRALDAVADFLALPKLRGQSALRIHPCIALESVESPHKRCAVYARLLAGEIAGYVAVRRKCHYHADTAVLACNGVGEKLARERIRRMNGTAGKALGIDTERPVGAILRGLGFCKAGTADALAMLGLVDRRYDLGELANVINVAAVPTVVRKYPSETGTIANLFATLEDKLPSGIVARIRALVTA